jgi:anti-sigma factor RsiW
MNHELRRVSPGEMLAYVDDCMPPADRAALEVRMARDHAVRNQIDIWLSQNEAIRGAFPGAAARPKAEGRSASKDYIPERRRQSVATRDLDRSPQVSAAPVGETKPTRQASGVLRRVLRVLAGGLAIWIGGAFICSGDRSSDFAKAAGAAYRTFADSATHGVELATADRRALNKWLVQQTEFSAGVPDLAAAGLSLLGGRIVPGSNSPRPAKRGMDGRRRQLCACRPGLEREARIFGARHPRKRIEKLTGAQPKHCSHRAATAPRTTRRGGTEHERGLIDR